MILSVFMLSFANALSKCNETECKKTCLIMKEKRQWIVVCCSGSVRGEGRRWIAARFVTFCERLFALTL